MISTGVGDSVRCYYCGGGLRNWEAGDDPWEEHAKWYPKCAHVILVKGQEYVDRVGRGEKPEPDGATVHVKVMYSDFVIVNIIAMNSTYCRDQDQTIELVHSKKYWKLLTNISSPFNVVFKSLLHHKTDSFC